MSAKTRRQTPARIATALCILTIGSSQWADAESPLRTNIYYSHSAAVPQRASTPVGAIQINPLMSGAPPQLLRFPNHSQPNQVAGSEPLPLRADAVIAETPASPGHPVDTLDGLSTPAKALADSTPQHRIASTSEAFGMLAIDQIGGHLSNRMVTKPDAAYPQSNRFLSDLVRPSNDLLASLGPEEPSFRDHLVSVDSESLIESEAYEPKPPAKPDTTVKQAKRTGGLLTPWLNRTRTNQAR